MSLNIFNVVDEHHAVSNGIYKLYKNLINKKTINWSLLRRNTHRLEKGLIMKPQKKVFALNYIEDTVDEFLKINKQDNNQTVKWTSDVLNEYFSRVELNDKLKNLKIKYYKHKLQFQNIFDNYDKRKFENEPYIPYENEKPVKKISYEDLLSLTIHRRSVRFFDSKKINNNILDKALLVARQSPAACNRLPYKYIIFNEKKKLQKSLVFLLGHLVILSKFHVSLF